MKMDLNPICPKQKLSKLILIGTVKMHFSISILIFYMMKVNL